jgi:hypothetical protein
MPGGRVFRVFVSSTFADLQSLSVEQVAHLGNTPGVSWCTVLAADRPGLARDHRA